MVVDYIQKSIKNKQCMKIKIKMDMIKCGIVMSQRSRLIILVYLVCIIFVLIVIIKGLRFLRYLILLIHRIGWKLLLRNL